ncbi:MAG: dTDP-4-dehydrorhamnose reductase [bacterium]
MKNILLIGNDGQVGFELQRALGALGQVTAVCYPAIDFSTPDSIIRVVREARPHLIVNAAAYTAVDKAETETELCRTLNAAAPAILAEEAKRLGAGLIHYSTDFVFDGARQQPYTETDQPHPLNVYGATKLEGDLAIRDSGVPHLIFRLAWVYGLRGKNFLLTMRRLASEGKSLRVVSDQIGCPTWCRTIADATATALMKVRADDGTLDLAQVSGLYHCVCAGQTSWQGFARAFMPADIPVIPITTADYPTPAKRPFYSVLNCDKFAKTFGKPLPPWETALSDCLSSG